MPDLGQAARASLGLDHAPHTVHCDQPFLDLPPLEKRHDRLGLSDREEILEEGHGLAPVLAPSGRDLWRSPEANRGHVHFDRAPEKCSIPSKLVPLVWRWKC